MKTLHQHCLLASARLEHIVLFFTMNQQKNAKRGLRKGYCKIRERKLFHYLEVRLHIYLKVNFSRKEKNILLDIFLYSQRDVRRHNHHERSQGPSGKKQTGIKEDLQRLKQEMKANMPKI